MQMNSATTVPAGKAIATLAGGCFWCLEAVYDGVKGVVSVESGYMGGQRANPTYEQVCRGDTGHVEVVRITFDPAIVSFKELLEVFFVIHDPTTLNRQGNDVGTQYRSAIYASSPAQREDADRSRREYESVLAAHGFGAITTEVREEPPFYYAEEYHQQYLAKNPHGYCGIGGTGVACAR
jgi:peptide-methionine (S)-S-oxide reductase